MSIEASARSYTLLKVKVVDVCPDIISRSAECSMI